MAVDPRRVLAAKRASQWALALAATAPTIVKAQSNLVAIGLDELLAVDPSLNGAGVRVAQVEAGTGSSGTAFEVNPATVGQPASLFTYIDQNGNDSTAFSPSAESSHADTVAGDFYGTTGSGVAPGVSHVDNYSADYFTTAIILWNQAIPDAVVNQSFDFAQSSNMAINIQDQQTSDTQYDNYIAEHGTIIVSGVGNGGSQTYPVAPSTCYNGIAVAVDDGPSGAGPTIDNGRSKPDITAPGGYTSFSTALVSGSAAILVQAGAAGDGGNSSQAEAAAVDPRTVKALLLNGADKQAVSFNRTHTAPLDPANGAGVLNVYNSYEQLTGGDFQPSSIFDNAYVGASHTPDQLSPAINSQAGWSFSTLTSSPASDAYANYVFQPPAGVTSYTLTATLDWERQFNINPSIPLGINNLSLYLYDTTTNTLIDYSNSPVDNVQDVYDANLTPGDRYDLEVLKSGGTPGITSGVVSNSETYALAFNFSAVQSVWDLSTGGSAAATSAWAGGIPDATTDTAKFGASITGPATVSFPTDWIVGNIIFDSSNSYTIVSPNGGPLVLDNGGRTATSNINDVNGSHVISAALQLNSNLVINVANAGNMVTLSGPVSGAGGMNITGSGTVKLTAASTTLSSLTVQSGARLDITTGSLAIDYGSAGNDPISSVVAGLSTGYAKGAWTGTGIISSVAGGSNLEFTIGYADGSADQGTSAAADQILLKYTLAGDALLQGSVGFLDLLAVAQNYGKTGRDWAHGNFTYDPQGSVGFADLLPIAQNYGRALATNYVYDVLSSGMNVGAVPEPAHAAIIAISSCFLARRRRRIDAI